MSLKIVDHPPTRVAEYDEHGELVDKMGEAHLNTVVEIFNTPLTGAYNWDYESADGRIRKLYSLGKELNWNAEVDVDWSITFDKSEPPIDQGFNPFVGYDEYEAMSDEDKLRFSWHNQAWTLSQFLHGEQGALLVASQLASLRPPSTRSCMRRRRRLTRRAMSKCSASTSRRRSAFCIRSTRT